VRRGYTRAHLVELCELAGLRVEEVGACSGVLSQKATWVTYTAGRTSPTLARVLTTPLHPVVAVLDRALTAASGWPPYSYCIEAVKPRFSAR